MGRRSARLVESILTQVSLRTAATSGVKRALKAYWTVVSLHLHLQVLLHLRRQVRVKAGPGNVLPEGVFEGPTTPPRQQKITPEIAPLPPTCPPGQELDEDTNLCFRVPQEQEEQQQQSGVTEEEQPVPVCQEGLEFNEDLGFCVPTECPEGQVLDDDSGLCVLEEPEGSRGATRAV